MFGNLSPCRLQPAFRPERRLQPAGATSELTNISRMRPRPCHHRQQFSYDEKPMESPLGAPASRGRVSQLRPQKTRRRDASAPSGGHNENCCIIDRLLDKSRPLRLKSIMPTLEHVEDQVKRMTRA